MLNASHPSFERTHKHTVVSVVHLDVCASVRVRACVPACLRVHLSGWGWRGCTGAQIIVNSMKRHHLNREAAAPSISLASFQRLKRPR